LPDYGELRVRESEAIGADVHEGAAGVGMFAARRRLVSALAALLFGSGLRAQSLPPAVALIVAVPPGGSGDSIGRLVAENLSDLMDTRIRVENVGGNGGVTGINAVASASRDGSVFGLVTSSGLIGGRILSRSAQYNPSQDFEWLAILGSYANAMVLSTRSNFTSLADWLAFARRTTTPLAYGTFGTGSAGHLAGAYLRYEQGANLTHVTVPGADEGYAMLNDGRIDVLFDGVPNALVKVPRSGQRIVAVTSAARQAALPDVPCFGELFKESFVVWIALVLPKGVPPAIYVRFASAVGVLVSEARYADSLRAAGLSFMGLSGSGTRTFVDNEFLRIARLIARLNDEGMRR